MVQFLLVVRVADTASAVTRMLAERKTSRNLHIHSTHTHTKKTSLSARCFSDDYFFSVSKRKQKLILHALPSIQIKNASIKAKRKMLHYYLLVLNTGCMQRRRCQVPFFYDSAGRWRKPVLAEYTSSYFFNTNTGASSRKNEQMLSGIWTTLRSDIALSLFKQGKSSQKYISQTKSLLEVFLTSEADFFKTHKGFFPFLLQSVSRIRSSVQ